MRRILLDEGVPVGVGGLVPGFEVTAVPAIGWARLRNGDLIRAAEQAGFEVMITCDQNMSYQQTLTGRRLAIVVLTTNHWDTIRANGQALLPAVQSATPGSFVTVRLPWPTRPGRPRRPAP